MAFLVGTVEGTRTCLQLLLDKKDVLFVWQEESLASMPTLFAILPSLKPTIVRKAVSSGVNLCTTSWLTLLQQI